MLRLGLESQGLGLVIGLRLGLRVRYLVASDNRN